MTREEIRAYLTRFARDPNRGCTLKMWCRDLAKLHPRTVANVVKGEPMSLETQKKLSEAIEGWRDGKYTRLNTANYEHIGLAPVQAPKMRKGLKISLGDGGPRLSVGIVNRRDYLGDLK